MKYIITLLFICIAQISFSQSSETLIAKNQKTTFSFSQPVTNMVPSPAPVYRQQRKENVMTISSYILGFAGGALIGYPLGTLIGGGEPNWVLAGVGAGLVGIAIPLSIIGEKKAKGLASVKMYNEDIYAASGKLQLNLLVASNEVGLRCNF